MGIRCEVDNYSKMVGITSILFRHGLIWVGRILVITGIPLTLTIMD